MTPKPPVVAVQSVSFSYNSRKILNNVSFHVSPGDVVGLIGPNGGGKTTLVKLILKLIPLTSGTISLFGEDLATFSDWKRISYIPQKATAFDQQFPATVFEIASLGRAAKGIGKPLTQIDFEKIMHALRLLGMEEYAHTKIGNLSGGQQQRVFIAKALAAEPDLLIMDEPTTGIDIGTEEKFYQLLTSINKKTNLTMIIISHDIHTLSRHVTKIECLNRTLRNCPISTFTNKRKLHKLEESLFSHEH